MQQTAVAVKPTVFIVDDDNAMCESLRWLIESVDLQVETFPSAQDFLAGYHRDKPGCLVLDVRMPGMSGLDLQDRLKSDGIGLPVLIVTGFGDVPMAVRAMKGGAVDFIEKPFSDQALLDRIQEAIERDEARRHEARQVEAIILRYRALTARGCEVMQLVVAGRSNKAIATSLNLSPKTVEVHRARVMSKMQAGSLAELVRMAHRADLVDEALCAAES